MIFIEILIGVVVTLLLVLLVFFIFSVAEYMGVNPIDDAFDRFFTRMDRKAKTVARWIERKVLK